MEKEEKIEWEKTDIKGFSEISEQIDKISKEVVKQHLVDITGKIEMLHRMGVLTNEADKLNDLKKKLKKMNIKIKV